MAAQRKTILVIDGQGGKIGRELIERIRAAKVEAEVLAVGTNSIATATMLKAGADAGATGENAVIVNSRTADLIVGPIGIIVADALMGEISPAMAVAVGQSKAVKLLIPLNLCNNVVVGAEGIPVGKLLGCAAEELVRRCAQ